MYAFLYLGIKLAAYGLWCFLGLAKLRAGRDASAGRALMLGFVRLLLGLLFGVVIWLASSVVLSRLGYGLPQNVVAYLLVYVPVRWLEWSIMAVILVPGSVSEFLLGARKPDRLWRLGGILISCLADIPLIISLGGVIPTGRFLC
ncbi:MAG TPA: hypothetical protein VN749_04160 [Candidatus Eisenbacteria bacterium]|nr:hypothetical protein [Candidatus Eisenbacteria bacterium]